MPKKNPETALFVKLPAESGEKLARVAVKLGVAKKYIVAKLVDDYLDPATAAPPPRKVTVDLGDPSPTLGSYSFQPYDPPEVLSSEQAAQLLQVDEPLVIELAEAGKLPGRKLGTVWRFSRQALVAWLAHGDQR
ncbi:MAG: helix-turn-helix domain-containing protein [Acidobacteriota bacterium]